jgi:hypothetical protein
VLPRQLDANNVRDAVRLALTAFQVQRLVVRPDGRCFLHACQASGKGPDAYNAAARQNGVPVDDVLKDRVRECLSLTCHAHTLSLTFTVTFTLTL